MANSVRVLAGGFSVGKIQNEDGELQPALIVELGIAFLMGDDNATDLHTALGEVVKSNVIQIAKPRELMAIPGERRIG